MKKSSIIVLFLLAVCASSIAQKLQIGISNGIGAAQLSNHREQKKDRFGADRVLSFTTGVELQVDFHRRWAISTGLNFTQKGTVRYYLSQKYRYTEVPISLRFNLRKDAEKAWQPFFQAGAYFSRLSKQIEKNIEPRMSHAEIYLLEYSKVQEFDHGVLSGLGMDFRLSPKFSVTIEGRMEHGLRDVFDLDWTQKKVFNVAAWGMAGVKYAF